MTVVAASEPAGRTRPSRRRAARIAAAGLTALLALSAVTGTAAAATGAIVSPAPGTTAETHGTVEIRADVAGPTESDVFLLLAPAGAAPRRVGRIPAGPGGSATYSLDTGCAEVSLRCIDERPAVNGTWTVSLDGADAEPRTFVLRIPPAAPREVTAVSGSDGVVVQWRRGAEPDLTAYDIRTADGTALLSGFPVAEACRDTLCRATVATDATSVKVRAQRAVCPDCADRLPSEDTTATVTAPGADPSGPAPVTPTPGTDSSAGVAGTPTASASASGEPAVAGVLPGLALASPGASPSPFDGAPLVAPPPLPVVAGAMVDDTVESRAVPRLDPLPSSVADRWPRFVAGALLLVLAAAHLQRWATAPTVSGGGGRSRRTSPSPSTS